MGFEYGDSVVAGARAGVSREDQPSAACSLDSVCFVPLSIVPQWTMEPLLVGVRTKPSLSDISADETHTDTYLPPYPLTSPPAEDIPKLSLTVPNP